MAPQIIGLPVAMIASAKLVMSDALLKARRAKGRATQG